MTELTAYNAVDEHVAITVVKGETHREAIGNIEDELVVVVPWSGIELLHKEPLAGDSSEQLFVFRVTAERHTVDGM